MNMNKFFHLKTHSIMAGGGAFGGRGSSTSVGGRSGLGALGAGGPGPGGPGPGGPDGGGKGRSLLERAKAFLTGEEEGRTGRTIGRVLGALSPVPFGSFLGAVAGSAIEKDIAAGGTATPEALASGAKRKGGGRTTIEGAPGEAATTAAPATASKELERARKVAAGGRAGTLLAGRTIAEEKQRKSLLGQ
jgi:hypothetical protein